MPPHAALARSLLLVLALHASADITLPHDAVVREIHPGVHRFDVERPADELSFYGFIWERDRTELELRALASNDRARGRRTVRAMVEARFPAHPDADVQPLAAVNGDFSVIVGPFTGSTNGPFIRDHRLLRFVNQRPALIVRPDGTLVLDELETTVTLADPDGSSITLSGINRPTENGGIMLYTPDWGWAADRMDSDAPLATLEVPLAWADEPPRALRSTDDATLIVREPSSSRGDREVPADGLLLAVSGVDIADDATRSRAVAFALGLEAGDRLGLTVRTTPEPHIREAVGGWPILVRDGQIVFEPRADEPAHPRTAVGFDDRHAMFVVVDGRQPGHSMGLTLPELAEFMHDLGCEHAMNHDGGGSSTCWVRGEVINRPSDGNERALPNGWALVSRTRVGPPAAVRFDEPGEVLLLDGAAIPLRGHVIDAHGHPVPEAPPIAFDVPPEMGRISDGWFIAETSDDGERTGALVATAGDGVRGELNVRVLSAPAALELRPTVLELLPGERLVPTVIARDAEGRVAHAAGPDGRVPAAVWSVDGPGEIEGAALIAGRAGSSATLTVTLDGMTASAPVRVAGPVPFEDFSSTRPQLTTFGPVRAGARWRPDDTGRGGWARLAYSFSPDGPTQAAYIRLDRPIGRALAVEARVRGHGQAGEIKAALVDGNGSRLLYTLHRGPIPEDWTLIETALPRGLKQPLTWQSLYVVYLPGGRHDAEGWVEVDDLAVHALPSP